MHIYIYIAAMEKHEPEKTAAKICCVLPPMPDSTGVNLVSIAWTQNWTASYHLSVSKT